MHTDTSITPDPLLSAVPDELQDRVRRHWQDWAQANNEARDPGVDLGLLGKLWACSEFIATHTTRRPGLWFELVDQSLLEQSLSLDDYSQAVREQLSTVPAANDNALMQVLRQFRIKHMLRIAWRDLAGLAETPETLANLTDLAEACVDNLLEHLHREQCEQLGTPVDEQGHEQRLIVLGMGKLGGHELNFSSDIDLIFGYAEEGETRGKRPLANSQFFTRLGQRLIRILNDTTADGFVFRVDMRLRPYGDSGPLAMSIDGMEHYFQTQGRDWERYAMIKARVIGGDREAGADLMAMLKPFIYRRYLDFGAFESIREMKAMIEKEIRRKGNRNNIKLGRGGIREIEFIGQTFQLIRGGGEPRLQVRGILQVLALLAEKGFLEHEQTQQLTRSYLFLRKLENRLQMYADGQTHQLPEDPLIRASVALAMDEPDWTSLQPQVDEHLQRVHGCFRGVFALEHEDEDAAPVDRLQTLWPSHLDDEDAREILQIHGFEDAENLLAQLRGFRDSGLIRALAGTSQQRLDRLMPLLLQAICDQPEAAETLRRLLNLLQAIVRRSVYLALLIEYPGALQQLVRLCAASPWIAHLLARYPILLDELLDHRSLRDERSRQQLADELDTLLQPVLDDEERVLDSLRKFKQAHTLRVAAMDLAGHLDVFHVSEQLTLLSEVLLCKVYELAWQHMTGRHGVPQCRLDGELHQPGMAIVAYGKMGGEELGYGSDLDIVFLHDSRGEQQHTDGERSLDNSTFFARLAQRIIHLLGAQTSTGKLYEVDTRLRPDGAAGMLVSSIDAFEQYQNDKAWTWEHQALMRARVVLGGVYLAEEFARIRRSVLSRPRDIEPLRKEVIEMRQKMRDALGSKKSDQFHLKQDAGGLVDIEFLVQFGVLAHAADHPEMLEYTATRQFLQALQEIGVLQSAQVEQLILAYDLYRARAHQRALQEQSSTLGADEFTEQRAYVTQIWQQLLGTSAD